MGVVVARNSSVTERSLAMLAIGAVLAFMWLARELLLPTALAVFVALAVHPLVRWLERRRVPRWAAAALGTLVASLVVAALAAVLYGAISGIWDELPPSASRAPTALGSGSWRGSWRSDGAS